MELSISLLVLSLMMGGALVMTTDILTRKNIETTEEKLAVIKDALDAYVERNGKLPCPASRTTTFGSPTYGRAVLADCVADTSTPAGTIRVDNGGVFTRIGALPARDLLIRDDYMSDEFGSSFTYAVTELLTSSTEYLDAGGSMTLNDGTGVDISTDIAYVVFSHGKDAKGAYGTQSGALKVACGATANLDVENCDGDDITFTRAAYNDGSVAAKYFDDQLVFKGKAPGAAPVDLCAGFRIDTPDAISSYATGDINGDGFADTIIGNASANSNGGYVYVVFGGNDDRPEGTIDVTTLNGTEEVGNGFRLTGAANSYAGSSVNTGDINHDGKDDIIIGANYGGAWNHGGEVYVIFGKTGAWAASTAISTFMNGTAGFALYAAGYEQLGIYNTGDVNNDTYADMLLGESNQNNGYGKGYVVFGKSGAWAAGTDVNAVNGTTGFIIPYAAQDYFGYPGGGALGDINNDGYDDILITKYGYCCGITSGAWVFFGKSGAWAASTDVATVDGTNGFALTLPNGAGVWPNIKNMNNDSYGDIIIGDADWNSASGSVYVVYGKTGAWSASSAITDYLNGTLGFRINGWGYAQSCCSWSGDFNNDGRDDLMIVALSYYDAGYQTVVFGKASAWAASNDLTNLVQGGTTGFYMGYSATTGEMGGGMSGDIDGDGFDDMIFATANKHIYAIYGRDGSWNDAYDPDTLATTCGDEAVDGPTPHLLDGLVAYWKLDEASGARAATVSSINLTDNNTVTSAMGKIGNAASFSAASSEYLSANAGTTFDFGAGDFTIAYWFKPNSSGTMQIINKDSDAAGGRQFVTAFSEVGGAGTIDLALFKSDSDYVFYYTGNVITVGAWNHVVVERTGGAMRIWVNGAAQSVTAWGTVSLPQTMSTTTTEFDIGRRVYAGYNQYVDGLVDEVGIWNRALTGMEVGVLYNSGNATPHSSFTP